jgi:hypothetical protein
MCFAAGPRGTAGEWLVWKSDRDAQDLRDDFTIGHLIPVGNQYVATESRYFAKVYAGHQTL